MHARDPLLKFELIETYLCFNWCSSFCLSLRDICSHRACCNLDTVEKPRWVGVHWGGFVISGVMGKSCSILYDLYRWKFRKKNVLNGMKHTCDPTWYSWSANLLETHLKEYMRSYIREVADLDTSPCLFSCVVLSSSFQWWGVLCSHSHASQQRAPSRSWFMYN